MDFEVEFNFKDGRKEENQKGEDKIEYIQELEQGQELRLIFLGIQPNFRRQLMEPAWCLRFCKRRR